MSKFKVWVKEHQNTLIGCAIGAVGGAVAAYVGYKIGFKGGFAKGANKGASAVATRCLIDSGLWDPNHLENKQWMFNWLTDKASLTVNDELAKIISDQGGELANTTVIAVTCRDLAH